MYRFSQVTYQPGTGTAVIGAGLIWDDVYAALAPHNVNVLGGRVTGVGVAGFILGGGKIVEIVVQNQSDFPLPKATPGRQISMD